MTDKERIEANLALVAERAPDVVARFYARLFQQHPELTRLFGRRTAAAQEKMVLDAIVAVVDHMDDPTWLESTLRPLGAKHATYGVTAAMYPWVVEALVETLGEVSGSAWNAAVEGAWVSALVAVGSEMMAGAREAERDAQPASQNDAPPTSRL